MPTEIYLVKVGMSMTEGMVEEWYIPDGSSVDVGELLYRLETEKVNLDVDAEVAGTVKHLVGEGITMSPGDVIGHIYAAGESMADLPQHASSTTAPPATPASVTTSSTNTRPAAGGRLRASPLARRLAAERNVSLGNIQGTGPDGRIVEADVLTAESGGPQSEVSEAAEDSIRKASPIARKLAREFGIDLAGVSGSGPGGRITKEDVEAAKSQTAGRAAPTTAESRPPTPVSPVLGERPDQTLPLKGMRKTIASRMHESLMSMAQLTMDMDVNMEDAVKLRTQLIEEWADQEIRPTYTDLVIRAAAKALAIHTRMNSQLTDSALVLKGNIHVGMAVALEDGLIVPVISNADQLSLREIAVEAARLAGAARSGSLSVDDLQDGTFTVSALGMFGVDSFTPIINSPQAGILGINRIRDDVSWDGNTPRKTQTMRLSLTWDHRVLDGAPAAGFLAEVRDLLEAPYRLLV
jgi:pyruvate dehydrogenase E2 component (dihydrolipoamide acetyltransferase)